MLNGLMKSNGWFPTMFDDFFNTDFMPRANSTAPAVNVKESEKAYTMELAAPGIKKEYCRVAINDEGNLTIAIDGYAAIFFLDAWSCKFHRVGLLTLLDIDCRCCTVGTFEAPC